MSGTALRFVRTPRRAALLSERGMLPRKAWLDGARTGFNGHWLKRCASAGRL